MVFVHANLGGSYYFRNFFKVSQSKVRNGMFLEPFMHVSYMSLYQKTVILKPSLFPHRSS